MCLNNWKALENVRLFFLYLCYCWNSICCCQKWLNRKQWWAICIYTDLSRQSPTLLGQFSCYKSATSRHSLQTWCYTNSKIKQKEFHPPSSVTCPIYMCPYGGPCGDGWWSSWYSWIKFIPGKAYICPYTFRQGLLCNSEKLH